MRRHVLLWGFEGGRRLPRRVTAALRSPANQTYVSVVSLWEIATKSGLGKLRTPDDLPAVIEANPDFEFLEITREHVWLVRQLPRLHGDPFDHLLIAQSMAEGMTLVTHDDRMAQYGVPILKA